PGTGAYQSPESPYYKWYIFRQYPHDYESWWGVDVLPNVNELEPSYREFIYGGEDSVVKHWVKAGAKGWRLDVADELPDEFIKELRQSLKETDEEAVLIGEVWEDASNKISYGKRREYLWGEGLDATMNYPLRQIWLDFLLGMAGASLTHRRIMSLYENYPRENFYAAMNLIGSHDRIRVLTLLGEAPPEDSLSEQEKEEYRLPPKARELAVRRLKLLVLMQMTFPGVPCIYYGDEAGLEGYSDPYNRGTYPWGREDRDLLGWYRRAAKLRQEYEVLIHGNFHSFHDGDDIYGFRRENDREEITVLINRNCRETKQVKIAYPPAGKEPESRKVLDLWAGTELEIIPDEPVKLPPLSVKVLYFRKEQAKVKNLPLPKAAGVLLPVTALSGSFGIGDLGKGAYRFVDFLAGAGQKIWQILPLNPLGLGNSPYYSPSSFAGNELLIDVEGLAEAGLLTDTQLEDARAEMSGAEGLGRVDYRQVRQIKEKLFKEAFVRFKDNEPAQLYPGYLQFRQENAYWLEDYCLYKALKEEFWDTPWYTWDQAVAQREAQTLAKLRQVLKDKIDYYSFLQYIFSIQWQKLKVYANSQGIAIFGDLPIYVAPDSCDTWARPELFYLAASGEPDKIAGVPPDYFSETGQLWGNPLYNWEEHARQGYRWWINRLRHSLTLVDYLRLDHFRGFEAYWEVPGTAETAAEGHWRKGPGKGFFEALYQALGPLPLIAEDLGYLTPEVHNLKHIFNIPGMKVFQFTPEEMLALSNPKDIFYTGTHDNDTLAGWCRENQKRLSGLVGNSVDGKTVPARKVIELLYQLEAPWVIVPLQDILGLGPEARLNIPGTAEGNWEWQFRWELLTEEVVIWLKELALASGRAAGKGGKDNVGQVQGIFVSP
ncbi:MAG: 4-alpha-glucanotransferase, partial [Clostridia bacterium]|nr:4-alpha-glucanotransferase [Clostridia bacterium]